MRDRPSTFVQKSILACGSVAIAVTWCKQAMVGITWLCMAILLSRPRLSLANDFLFSSPQIFLRRLSEPVHVGASLPSTGIQRINYPRDTRTARGALLPACACAQYHPQR